MCVCVCVCVRVTTSFVMLEPELAVVAMLLVGLELLVRLVCSSCVVR